MGFDIEFIGQLKMFWMLDVQYNNKVQQEIWDYRLAARESGV